MKIAILTFLLSLLQLSLSAQNDDTWTAFWNKDTTLIGYKDKNGLIKLEPKFRFGFTNATRFNNIIAVSEEAGQGSKLYYLTKSGRIVGRDSLHIFDQGSDCESEGFIRFRDRKTDKVGMFDRNGNIVIPAEYNELTRVANGMIVAKKGATKKIFESGEHYCWVGGETVLIDTANKILVDSFNCTGNINFYSLLVSKHPNPDPLRLNIKTADGKFLSFIDFDKEFNAWLKNTLLINFTKNQLLDASFKEVTFWKEQTGWTSVTKQSFIDRNFELIKTKLLQLNSKECQYHIFDEGLNPFIFESDTYNSFFNNCGESKDWIYPVKSIVISYEEGKDLIQDQIDFLRTDNGYKLISVSFRKDEIR